MQQYPLNHYLSFVYYLKLFDRLGLAELMNDMATNQEIDSTVAATILNALKCYFGYEGELALRMALRVPLSRWQRVVLWVLQSRRFLKCLS